MWARAFIQLLNQSRHDSRSTWAGVHIKTICVRNVDKYKELATGGATNDVNDILTDPKLILLK